MLQLSPKQYFFLVMTSIVKENQSAFTKSVQPAGPPGDISTSYNEASSEVCFEFSETLKRKLNGKKLIVCFKLINLRALITEKRNGSGHA